MALRKRGLARRVVGVDVRAETLESAQALGAIDVGTREIIEAVREADCLVLAAPVGVIPSLMEQIAPHIRPDALVTDLGSTKTRIVETGNRIFGGRFVGGHPMAGSERGGIDAARADLFDGAAWGVVSDAALAPKSAAARLVAMVTRLGAHPILLDAAQHDRLVALVSHLPHVLSFAFARTVNASPDGEQARRLAGGSYQDMMRVSHANPALWRDIFLDNRAALLDAITTFESALDTLRQAIELSDNTTLDHPLG